MNPHRAKILVVDDDPASRQLLRTLMRQLNVESVDEVGDGAAALELMHHNKYDLVLADWNMPIINGLQLVKIVGELPAAMRPPVVLISCDVSKKRSLEAVVAGVSGLVGKPFVNDTLCKKVLRILALAAPVFDVLYAPPSHTAA